ncbi:efflux RND transporter periplasmic adaptor subunit [Actinoplanes sp. NPDC051859]|uniref:efflux RND transporter periplasmic adaptor subunit n=1 Tax=Actinoplanes sp. NPDC051859 TaxID=3363909 RepID=UPI0037A91795
MRRLTSHLVNLVLLAVLVGAATWSVFLVRGTSSTTPVSAASRTVTATKGTVTATVTADGTLEPVTGGTADFATDGTVTTIYVKVGDQVGKGDLLAKVDPAAAQRDLALAQADLTAAYDAVDRAEDAGTDTTTAQNAVAQALLAVDEAEAAVTGTSLTAPMAGTVVAVNGTVGSESSSSASSSATGGAGGGASGGTQTASASSGFIQLADLSKLQVTADFSEADATKLQAGQDATIEWSALTDAEATGKVLSIDPSGTSSSGVVTYGVTVSVGALPVGARPGQSVQVAVVTGTAEDVVSVSSAAVTLTGSRYTVGVPRADGTTETRQVEVGVKGADAYEIVSGLTAGERVILPATSSTSSTSGNSRQGPAGGGGFGTGGGPGGNGGPP